jgi:hypothetical protein
VFVRRRSFINLDRIVGVRFARGDGGELTAARPAGL